MKRLTVLYDASCGFCVECAIWLNAQRQRVKLELLEKSSVAAMARFPTLARTDELTVVSDEGGVYRNAHAWIMCLWALRDYRRAAERLSRPALLPFARAAFALLSKSRHSLSRWLDLAPESELLTAVERARTPHCAVSSPHGT